MSDFPRLRSVQRRHPGLQRVAASFYKKHDNTMKTDWARKVDEINRKRFTVPLGWDTRDQVAESLQCDPDRVSDILKPGIQSGDIERSDFPVWDDRRRMTVRTACYRLSDGKVATSAAKASGRGGKRRGGSVEERIAAALERNPGASNRDIAKNLYGVRSSDVEAVRATL